jgi:peroxiredoxin
MNKSRLVMMGSVFAIGFLGAAIGAKSPAIGTKAPDFTLTDTSGNKRSLSDFKGKHVVLEWINHGCPFVKKHYNTNNMQTLQREFTAKGVIWLSICSSAKGKQGHMSNDEWNKTTKNKEANPTAVLIDGNGKVGKKYDAKTTPHIFIIDPEGNLVYKGAIDDKATTDKNDVPTAKNYVRAALEESLAGQPVSIASTESYGCSVKY